MKKYVSLYVHIPFCVVKCKYCDFLSFDGESYGTMLRYVDCLCQEIKMYAPIVADYSVRSIFIGGGTPSLLDESLITNIMAFIRRYFHVEKNAEVTIEANPGTLRHQKLNGYKAAGINRISIGLQSCDDDMLKKLGRIHNFDQFVASYNAARRAGFQNINIDIMSGLPGQTIHTYVDTLSRVIEFGPEHISAYSLSIEEGTPFARDPQILNELPPEMVDRRMYEITKQLLAAHGYDRYEFSNYVIVALKNELKNARKKEDSYSENQISIVFNNEKDEETYVTDFFPVSVNYKKNISDEEKYIIFAELKQSLKILD